MYATVSSNAARPVCDDDETTRDKGAQKERGQTSVVVVVVQGYLRLPCFRTARKLAIVLRGSGVFMNL